MLNTLNPKSNTLNPYRRARKASSQGYSYDLVVLTHDPGTGPYRLGCKDRGLAGTPRKTLKATEQRKCLDEDFSGILCSGLYEPSL